MAHPAHGQPIPPTAGAVVKRRNGLAVAALILAVMAWLAAGVGIWLIRASHAWTDGCLVDTRLHGAGILCDVLGVLLGAAAGVSGLISLRKPTGRGAYRAMGVAAVVMGAIVVAIGLFLISAAIRPGAISPAYLHPC